MPWGFVAGAAIGAVGSVVAGGEQASGQEAAANTQQSMFNTIQKQEQPYMTPGNQAETTLSELLGTSAATGSGGTATGTNLPGGYLTQTFNPTQQDLENYPGYQFELGQGDLAVNSANSAGGSALSGPALKSLMSFNQGLAASNYQNYFNQFQTQQNNIFNRLQNIASLGQNAASNTGSAGASLGTGIAQAQAAAAGSIAGGIAGATNNVGQSILLSNLMNGNTNDPYASDQTSFSLGGSGSVVSDPGYGGGS